MATISLELKKWNTPNFATVKGQDGKSIPVSEIPESALRELADEWLDELFSKAGHSPCWRWY